jgi:hypothetical protein
MVECIEVGKLVLVSNTVEVVEFGINLDVALDSVKVNGIETSKVGKDEVSSRILVCLVSSNLGSGEIPLCEVGIVAFYIVLV